MISANVNNDNEKITLEVKDYIGGNSDTNDYENLINKPSINGTTLSGNLSLEDIGIDIEKENIDFSKYFLQIENI